MPHILFNDWKQRIQQLHGLSGTIHDALEEGEYDGDPQKKAEAQSLVSQCESFISKMPAVTEADDLAGAMEVFLGI